MLSKFILNHQQLMTTKIKGTTTAATAEPMCGHHQAPLCQQCTKFPSTVRRVFGETELGASGQQKDAL